MQNPPVSKKKTMFSSLALCLLTFGSTLAAFAQTAQISWPSCAASCQQYGPGGSNEGEDQCSACCTKACANGDYADCYYCCGAYNHGSSSGPSHCQG